MDMLAKLIVDTIDAGGDYENKLGSVFLDSLQKKESILPESQHVISPEIDEKIRVLKIEEANHNLCWMDYRSWFLLPTHFHEAFKELLNPLLWAGVFCKYDQFLKHEYDVLITLTPEIGLFERLDMGNVRLTFTGEYGTEFENLSIMKLAEVQKRFAKSLIRTVGKDYRGQLVFNYYRGIGDGSETDN